MALINDFLKAVAQMTDGRFLMVLLKALGLTIALLGGFAVAVGWLASFIPTDLGEWWLIGKVELPSITFQGVAFSVVLFLSSFLMIPVAAVFVGLYLEEIAAAVEAKHYPSLPPARSVGLVESLGGSLRFLAVMIGVNLIALLPYLILLLLAAPLAYLLGIAINGYLLGREYFELVAARHVPSREARALRSKHWTRTWFAGICMTVPLSIPIMNLLVPVLGVATITHQVQRLRKGP